MVQQMFRVRSWCLGNKITLGLPVLVGSIRVDLLLLFEDGNNLALVLLLLLVLVVAKLGGGACGGHEDG